MWQTIRKSNTVIIISKTIVANYRTPGHSVLITRLWGSWHCHLMMVCNSRKFVGLLSLETLIINLRPRLHPIFITQRPIFLQKWLTCINTGFIVNMASILCMLRTDFKISWSLHHKNLLGHGRWQFSESNFSSVQSVWQTSHWNHWHAYCTNTTKPAG